MGNNTGHVLERSQAIAEIWGRMGHMCPKAQRSQHSSMLELAALGGSPAKSERQEGSKGAAVHWALKPGHLDLLWAQVPVHSFTEQVVVEHY